MVMTSIRPRVTEQTAGSNSVIMSLLQTARFGWRSPMDSECYFNQQIIERYRKLLDIVSDQTQRRQIMNLIEEEEDKAKDLGRSRYRHGLSEAA